MKLFHVLPGRAVAVASLTAAALAGGGFALAASSGPSVHPHVTPVTYWGCIEGSTQTLEKVRETSFATCPKGAVGPVTWNQQGPADPARGKGRDRRDRAAGTSGTAGPSRAV